ncbi:Wzz/FepE/Etk N-terminal domain-containing protein [Inmirania thermothiophila]|uniref:Subunit length determinant protein n=1 Tax=Inmirania thermothiophila TaxID=1750597 RepID=A0A3N1Y260_9GAMM|nr:Wzz/FepE/Etk N-terminal domain-containing protein [Inmirania thermothiophila]ROR32900.1 subunit length determinant protein [Inmirania thermothiophila]
MKETVGQTKDGQGRREGELPQVWAPAWYPPEDELSLVDLWLEFRRRRRVFWAVFAVVLVAGLAAAVLLPERYSYTTVIQLAGVVSPEGTRPLVSPSEVLEQVRRVYLPAVLAGSAQGRGDVGEGLVEAERPKDTDLIVLESVVPEAEAGLVRRLHETVARRVVVAQQDLVEAARAVRRDALVRLREVIARQGEQAFAKAEPDLGRLEELVADQVRPARIEVLAQRGLEPKGRGRAAIAVLAVVAGVFAGLGAVFVDAFRDRVREALAEEEAAA